MSKTIKLKIDDFSTVIHTFCLVK